ncbi:MAG: IclR family transcriptional regulator [Actinomycetota bacterium]|nr:IclR family transcriptional regulator [Actinomycetota bacterium]
MSAGGTGIQSVERALDVLEHIACATGEVSLSELAAATGMPLTTIHRLVKTLEHRGYVRRDGARRYGLGAPLIGLGEAASRLLGTQAQPFLTELMEDSGETANLALLEGDHVVYVASVASRHRMRMFTEVGNRVLPHCTAVGKVLLSDLPADHAERLLRRSGLPRRTPDTITDLDVLLAQLAEIRARGFAVDAGEEEVGVRCFAVPVPGDGGAVAAMSVSGPQARLTDEVCARVVPQMQRLAARFAAELSLVPGDRPDG